MACKFLLLCFLLFNGELAFSGDTSSSSNSSSFEKIIPMSQVRSLMPNCETLNDDLLTALRDYPESFFTEETVKDLIRRNESLARFSGQTGEDFKVGLVQIYSDEIMAAAAINEEDLRFKRYYKEGQQYTTVLSDDKSQIVDLGYDRDKRQYYRIEDPNDTSLYYDKGVVVDSMLQLTTMLDEFKPKSKTKLYTGKSRYTLSSCLKPHPFHSKCIKRSLENAGPACPICRAPATKDNLKYSNRYKSGELCGVCQKKIVPVRKCTEVGSVSAGAGASSSAAGTAAATPVSSRKSSEYRAGRRSAAFPSRRVRQRSDRDNEELS